MSSETKKFILRPYQDDTKRGVYEAWNAGHINVLVQSPTGSGKCLGKGTPILMYDGSIKPVEVVVVGDCLMGPDSTPRRVLSLARGREPLFRITPVKGDSHVVNVSHILSLKNTSTRRIRNVSVGDYLKTSKNFKHVHKLWRTGVDFPKAPRIPSALPPRMLGIWLGDGTSRTPSITTMEPEISEYALRYAYSRGLRVRCELQKNNKSSVFHIVRHAGGVRNALRDALKANNLLQNKHIPIDYLTASRENRLELLAGILDTDGYLHGGTYDLVFKHLVLAEDTVYLCRSLGLAAYLKPCTKTCTNTGASGIYYRISISGELDQIPCIVPRRMAQARKQKKSVLVTGFKVEPQGDGDYYGFEIDGDRLFMLGDFTVTHNTVIFADIIHEFKAPSCVLAHRSEIIGQISVALARQSVPHRIIAPDKLRKYLENLHTSLVGRSWVNQNAACAVGSVQTITSKSRRERLKAWCQQVQLWVQDEAHHVLNENQWGKAVRLFPNARGLGVTATPCRADGKGLGRKYDGLFDTIVKGADMKWLIDNGHLTPYRIFAPATDIDFSRIKVGATGDYTNDSMKKQVRQSPIVGDVVAQYMRLAMGKLNVVFATDVETAGDFVKQFQEMGVSAALVTAKTPDRTRREILQRFARREILVLVNVDLFGEGFDLPAIEVVSMARPTQSFTLFCQQFGRALRPMDGKTHALIIDHVGNCVRHGLPDAPREWSLEPRDKKTRTTLDPNLIPLKTCLECAGCYEAVLPCCPYCTHINEIVDRSKPSFVDGDLTELDIETMNRLRGIIAKKDTPAEVIAQRMVRDHVETAKVIMVKRNIEAAQASQAILRATVSTWAKLQQCLNRNDSEIYKRFYWKFGTDVMSAQILGRADADLLNEKIRGDMHVK